MDGYTNVFGGENISPAQLDYVNYAIATDIVLVWPFQQSDATPNVAAHKIDIFAQAPGLKVFMPSAAVETVGQDALIRNTGSIPFTVVDFAGNTLVNITSGLQWMIWITDNTTDAGQWAMVQFGAGASNASAGALAGAGLRANITKLDQNLLTTPLLGNHSVQQGDRATVLRNDGGAVVYGFDPSASLGNGFFVYAINGGSGTMTLLPNGVETIDGQANKVLAPGESCIIFSDGSKLETLGYGRSLVNTVTGASINIAPGGPIALTSTQIAAQVQDFTGGLTSNATLDYGSGIGYWFVYNNTTGAFSTTAKAGGLDPGVVIPQGSFSILRSNGTNMAIAFTATTGTVTTVNTAPDELVGGPITTVGTIGLANTAVAPGTYGDASHIVQLTVDQKGRITNATSVQIDITGAVPIPSAAFAAIITDATGTAGKVVLSKDPVLEGNPTAPTATPGDNDQTIATTAFVTAAIAAAVAALQAQMFQTGDFLHTNATMGERPGWVWATGSIGNGVSGATTRANDDTLNLFTFCWNKFSNTLCPVSTGRGASPAADFAAGKTLTFIDARGMVMAAAEDMGGTNRNNLGTNPSTGGFAGTASLGQTAGEKAHTQVRAEVAPHDHPTTDGSTGQALANFGITGAGSQTGNTGNLYLIPKTGLNTGGQPANVTQPTQVCNILLKL